MMMMMVMNVDLTPLSNCEALNRLDISCQFAEWVEDVDDDTGESSSNPKSRSRSGSANDKPSTSSGGARPSTTISSRSRRRSSTSKNRSSSNKPEEQDEVLPDDRCLISLDPLSHCRMLVTLVSVNNGIKDISSLYKLPYLRYVITIITITMQGAVVGWLSSSS